MHSEKTPSFKVDSEKQTFYCFGCHAHGDVISFIQAYRALSFKEAIKYLGISNGKPVKPNLRETRKRQLIKAFRQWCDEYHDDLYFLCRLLQVAKEKAKSIEQVELLSPLYHEESIWLYQIEILEDNDDQAKLDLYREVVYGN